MKGLYIHIPFCHHICSYCDFAKVFYNKKYSTQYLQNLKEELSQYAHEHFDTIYIGGGTPSSLDLEELEFLLNLVQAFQPVSEFTIELNPENTDKNKLKLMKDFAVNRLSIGVQSTNDQLLKAIGRVHNQQQVETLIQDARTIGFTNISIDLMYGLPQQSIVDIEHDLKWASNLGIEHISYYSLILEERTKLKIENFKPLDEDKDAYIYGYINNELDQLGFKQYEISNYAKHGFESKHNLIYWHFNEYVGVGLKATSYVNHQMIENTASLKKYLEGQYVNEVERLGIDDEAYLYIMMGLRLTKGIKKSEFESRFGKRVDSLFPNIVKMYHEDMLEDKGRYIKATKKGIPLLNYILENIL